ncbi:MAG: hypothetical protein M1813_003283 [Trichoglossum hirsutum]|nr:MAG: hypothetical protein M1813_003283 [Trichoglossum hirsutum]
MVLLKPLDTTNTPIHIAIVGGGIGGLALSVGLYHQVHSHLQTTIYEASPSFSEIGAGVSVGPNAQRALSLLSPSIQRAYDHFATSNGWPEKKKIWFEFRHGMKGRHEGKKIAEVSAGETGQSTIHRARLLDILVNELPDKARVKFGKRVVRIEPVKLNEVDEGKRRGLDGGVRLVLDDGTEDFADAVVACDGVRSTCRRILMGEEHSAARPVFSGKYVYRTLIPVQKLVDAVGDELARNSQMYLGKNGHVLTYPVEKGEIVNIVACKHTHGKWKDDRWILQRTKEEMMADYASWGTSVQKIITLTLRTKLIEKPEAWGLFDQAAAPTYTSDRLCLMGDAAHAATAHQAAGVGQVLEDALILSHLLGAISSPADIERAFHAYDSVRRERTQRVVSTSREAARVYQFEDEIIGDDLDKIAGNLTGRYDWIWEVDLDEELRKAKVAYASLSPDH